MEASLTEQQVQLAEYSAQLAQVDSLLAADSANAELLKLRADLAELVALSQQSIQLQAAAAAVAAPLASTVAPNPAAGPAPPPAAEDATPEAPGGGGAPPALGAVGTLCEAPFQGGWFPAVVKADDCAGGLSLSFLGYDDEAVRVEASKVRALSHYQTVPRSQVVPGFECDAYFASDGKWFAAVVEAPAPHGCRVRFAEYGNVDTVPLEYLRHRSSSATTDAASGTGTAAAASPNGAAGTASSFVVPDHLRLLATDTDEQRAKKRKKVKALKLANKGREVEQEHRERQASWQSFQKHSAGKSSKIGKGLKKKRGSIFATPDAVNGKVGVTNSGRGTTEFEQRKKYRLN